MESNLLSYEYERDDYYCYPDSSVLINKLNIYDNKELSAAEREITSLKAAELLENPLKGELNFDYIKMLHRHLFEDIYDWAGEIRRVDISKGNIFCQHELIEVNADFLFNELKNDNYLANYNEPELIEKLAYYMGDLNSIHPFREGNGRVQRAFIRELASRIGYLINFDTISQKEMIEASNAAFNHDYEPLTKIMAKSLSKM